MRNRMMANSIEVLSILIAEVLGVPAGLSTRSGSRVVAWEAACLRCAESGQAKELCDG